jgi:hypothetical protein
MRRPILDLLNSYTEDVITACRDEQAAQAKDAAKPALDALETLITAIAAPTGRLRQAAGPPGPHNHDRRDADLIRDAIQHARATFNAITAPQEPTR